MISYSIRNANTKDLPQIMKIEANAFITPIQEEESVFFQRISIYPELFFVFEDSNQIFGYLSGEYISAIPETSQQLKLGHIPEKINFDGNSFVHKYIYINSFAILNNYRGNGIGNAIWNDTMNLLARNKPEKIILLVNEAWKGASHIYEKNGFSIYKILKSFFPTTEANLFTDGFLMKKDI